MIRRGVIFMDNIIKVIIIEVVKTIIEHIEDD